MQVIGMGRDQRCSWCWVMDVDGFSAFVESGCVMRRDDRRLMLILFALYSSIHPSIVDLLQSPSHHFASAITRNLIT